ncbi:4Fe-4S dicluster domain-containing protein [Acerihabitans sp. TG2]|uniref:4Fe-4S dicluster domain-containing protein n=1 Tax=Acerihabitans sp. TG2 TaxID=3096008 RepID=UPI002B22222A|nr:4Fe-4S dicluster domain-containing protein [Acerihabitans sp. TG2]MEA9389871.1 4Fe-4S dicluster domain-containing protein [Acerihabitans sp. TG2]
MNQFIVVDSTQCIGCRTCEIACATAHSPERTVSPATFSPRLKVVKTAMITMPVLCRQCENAPCANACPAGAIVYQQNSVQVRQSLCIGCKACTLACPFGMISVSIIGTAVADTRPAAHYATALKCDMCSGRSQGPACVEMCPTGALNVMRPEMLEHNQQQKQRRVASGIISGLNI